MSPGNAIVGIDLADDKQAAVVTDHDSRVIARREVRAWELGDLLDWAVARAAGAGFRPVTVACEPTGAPAVLGASGSPFRPASWRAALAVVLDRCAGDLGRVRRLATPV